MATSEQLSSYHGQCSDVSFSAFDMERSVEYDPADADYYEDINENHGTAGGAVGTLCLVVFVTLIVFGFAMCCFSHHWLEHMDFIGIARKGTYWWQRLLGLLFVCGIIVCTVLVIAMSIWGIVKVEKDVRDVVPKSFDFLEDTEQELSSIHSNLTAAVANGNNIVIAVRLAINEVRQDTATEQLTGADSGLNQSLVTVLNDLEQRTSTAEDALDIVEVEINENLDDLLNGMRDAVGYRDEGEGINDFGRIVVIAAFSLFVVLSVVATLASLCGASARFTYSWAVVMWCMLWIAFWIVWALSIAREVSRESCLYVDTFAVKELRNEVKSDPQRAEDLLWYYFRPADRRTKSLAELEDLWSFPLTDVVEFLNLAENEIFNEDGLNFPYSLGEITTQEALLNVRALIPQARRDIAFVQDLIEGETFHDLHSDFKDLVCCVEYDAVDSVWTAWVVSSSFGLVIAVLMTMQAMLSFKCGRRPVTGGMAVAGRVQTQKTSAYMAPPVAESTYAPQPVVEMTPRKESGVPLRGNNEQSSAAVTQPTVYYPTVQPPTAYF